MTSIHISLTAEKISSIFNIPITNSILTTWILIGLLFVFSVIVKYSLKNTPGKTQLLLETAIQSLRNLFKSAPYFPLLASLFIFILISNWSGLIPGISAIELNRDEHSVHLFRAPTADINTTLALALISMVVIQYHGFKSVGLGYLKKFFDFSSPIAFFVGILELISEFSRLISFTFRLFGNIFAGEVLLLVVAFLVPLALPIPFLGMEIFVGFIQALVFSLLVSVFLNLAASHHTGTSKEVTHQ